MVNELLVDFHHVNSKCKNGLWYVDMNSDRSDKKKRKSTFVSSKFLSKTAMKL